MWAEEVITWEKVTNYSSLSTTDTYVIAGNYQGGSTWYSLKNNQVSTAAYLSTGSTLTISDNKITSTISGDETWVLEATETAGQFYIKSTKGNYYLQNASNTKSTIKSKSSTDNENIWKIHYEDTYTPKNSSTTYTVTGLYNIAASRTLAFYGGNNNDWRCYANTNYSNFDGAEVVLFKRVVTDSSSPSINATNPAKLAYNATSGEISYTIDNPVDGASISASTEANWISNFSYATAGKVTYTVRKNTTLEDRNATVTLTYAKDATTYATKNVTVSQGHLDVAAPTFDVTAGTYNAAQSVGLSTDTEGAGIYYTTDGSTPTSSSTPYSAAIAVNVSMTIKAIAVKDGVSTAVAEAAYVLKAPITIAPNGGTFEESQEVTLSSVAGATIKYTLDNSDPSGEGALTYSAPFTLTATKTVKAIATKSGWTSSDVASATFTKIDPNDVWVKTGLSALASDDVFVIVGEKTVNQTTTTHAMSNDNGTTDGPDAIAVTISNNMISGTVANKIKWNVSRSNDGYTFYPNGSTTTWLYCTGSNDGVRIGTSDDKNFTISTEGYLYNTGKSCYVGIYNSSDWRRYGTINANISGQTFATYKHGISVTLAAACTDGNGKYYATFSSSVPFKVPADVTVSEIGITNEGKLNVVDYAVDAVVPANTGVMISSTTAGKKTFTPASGGTSVLGANNRLRPSGFAISDITAKEMSDANENCKFYRLTMHNGTQIGFYWGAASGAAFTLGANKAYLAVPTGAGAPSMLWFDNGSTGINSIDNGQLTIDNVVYNLSGQRVANPTKGLYIVNGKKVVIK